jgi:hypothetical protein
MEKSCMSSQEIHFGDTTIQHKSNGENGSEFSVGESTVRVNAKGELMGAEAFGNQIEVIEGGFRVTRADGSVFTVIDGSIEMTNFSPKKVGLSDLSQVASYTITNTEQGSVHRAQFVKGGCAEVTYDVNGKVISCNCDGGSGMTINKDNEVLLSWAEAPEKAEVITAQ